MRLIGIHGHARAGKDTVGRWLDTNRRAHRDSFAWPIRHTISVMFNLPSGVWDDPVAKEATLEGVGKSPRYLAQTLGTEWGRDLVHSDLWVKLCEMRLRICNAWQTDRMVVITDVRFPNEAAWIREHGTLLHVYRDGANGDVGIMGHASEQGIPLEAGDIMVSNNGTLDELYGKLGGIFPRPIA